MTRKTAPWINESCTNCGVCAQECPSGAISKGGRSFVIDSDLCEACLICAKVCPADSVEHPELPRRPRRPRKSAG